MRPIIIGCCMLRAEEHLMDFQDVAFLPFRASFSTRFLKNCGRCEGLGMTTFLKIVIGASKGMIPAIYLRSKKSFLCQLNFMEIIRLSQS